MPDDLDGFLYDESEGPDGEQEEATDAINRLTAERDDARKRADDLARDNAALRADNESLRSFIASRRSSAPAAPAAAPTGAPNP
jgi:hypothetical protein